jgi:SulP family sulfate permease
MQLGLGPVAIVSLLTGNLINQYKVDWANDPEAAVNTASQAALGCGIILTVMGIFKIGTLIRYISHPVMSGFTTAAAMLIGISQLKAAFGFTVAVPQVLLYVTLALSHRS